MREAIVFVNLEALIDLERNYVVVRNNNSTFWVEYLNMETVRLHTKTKR